MKHKNLILVLPDGSWSSIVEVSCVDAALGLTAGASPSVDVATTKGGVRAEKVDVRPTSAFFAVGGVVLFVALIVRFLGICARQEDFLQHRITARRAKDDVTKIIFKVVKSNSNCVRIT